MADEGFAVRAQSHRGEALEDFSVGVDLVLGDEVDGLVRNECLVATKSTVKMVENAASRESSSTVPPVRVGAIKYALKRASSSVAKLTVLR